MKENIRINDRFWKRYRSLVRTEMIPYQWNVLNDAIDINIEKERNDASIPSEKSHAIENFRIAAGRTSGDHYGWVFQDSDVYKWLEAAAYSLNDEWDDELKKTADEVVDLIVEAQQDDGYLNTYFTIKAPERRYTRLAESHELYCAGHFIEAAVAYYEAAGNEKVLMSAKKLADHICNTFGTEDGKIRGIDGHEEIEIGLMRLYHLTLDEKYMKEAEYFLLERGKDPKFFDRQWANDKNEPVIAGLQNFPREYFQIHLPLEEQDTAEGHAVRLVYMCTALADLAATSGNKKLADICKKIWRNIVDKRMYITGGIGSTVIGESFTLDYDLPNDTMYCETCAAVGLIFFARQMLRIEPDGEYADVMERALYNNAIAGMALDGKHFFYVNPLEAVPEKSKKDPTKSHVKPVRPQWLGCACCPPNLARMIESLEENIYTVNENEILVNLFMGSELKHSTSNGAVCISQTTDYPKSGKVSISVDNESGTQKRLGIRIPAWTDTINGKINGQAADISTERGYWFIDVTDKECSIELEMDIQPQRWYTNVSASENIRKVAIARGPFVYCIEGVDNGEDLHRVMLDRDSKFEYEWAEDLLNGVGVITAKGKRIGKINENNALYFTKAETIYEDMTIKLIPYYAWANRGENEMRVWIRETDC